MISILIHTNLHKNVRIDAGKIVIVIIFKDSRWYYSKNLIPKFVAAYQHSQ